MFACTPVNPEKLSVGLFSPKKLLKALTARQEAADQEIVPLNMGFFFMLTIDRGDNNWYGGISHVRVHLPGKPKKE